MISIDMDDLPEEWKLLVQRVRDEGVAIEVTFAGEALARIFPVRQPPSVEEIRKRFADLDKLSEEISAHWPEGVSAVDAVREQRREL